METDPRIVILGEDIHRLNGGTNGATKGLAAKYPGRILGTPISENAFAGLGGGMAMDGRFRPVIEFMYADFMWVAADQIFNQIGKARHMFGGTHDIPVVLRTKVAMGSGYGSQHLMDPAGVVSMQFHANMSYEDFIRGWRPNGKGELVLTDGPFMELVRRAKSNPREKFVFVIEEINRGNPAQIFGEMLTLLENDKRREGESLQLTYRGNPEERIYIPENLYVIGTMNTADKSLAILDFAFRRRFAFNTLEPLFNQQWQEWLRNNFQIPLAKSEKLQVAIENLNRSIREDQNLGSSYEIGHSYFTPGSARESENFYLWVNRVMANEIAPTLSEYWYDNPSKATEVMDQFVKDLN